MAKILAIQAKIIRSCQKCCGNAQSSIGLISPVSEIG